MKNSHPRYAICIVVLLAAGCGTTSNVPEPSTLPTNEPAPTAEASKDTCGAEPLKILIGKSIATVQMPSNKNVRLIGPTTQVTKDYRIERMNIHLDEEAIIKDITCG